MSTTYIARFSITIFFLCSNVFADTFLIPMPYDHCFKNPYYKDVSPPAEESLAIGECFYQVAENISPDDYQSEQHDASSSRTHITTSLHYAGSWFRLAIQQGSTDAVTPLHKTERYLVEDQQQFNEQKNAQLLPISK